ncbi:MAG: Crp/Fnr family transcriptional regulator [Spirochaetes bacterium]|nr:Crp/Fnr family transcriptional regulator [Spirochaetota bacterium]MBU1081437.1 Crp/Fnr family transcriptional regulator [Spirochaetota bacterium]
MLPDKKASEILSCLKNCPLFDQVGDDVLRRLSTVCAIKRVEKGAVLFTEGEASSSLFVVMSGSVVEYVTGPNDLELAVKERRPFDYFGEISMLIEEPNFVTAIASQPSVLAVIPRNEFLARTRTEPSISQHIIRVLAHRLLLSAHHQIAFLYLDASSRLAYLLLTLEAESGGTGVVTSSQESLAQRCGLARQTVARLLGEWKDADWIKTSRGRIEDIDTKALNHILTMSCYDKDINAIGDLNRKC